MSATTLRVGITGPIGSGKSYVAERIAALGYGVYNADHEAKRLIESDERLRTQIISLLGKEAYDSEGHYDTKYVSSRVFNQRGLLVALNAIVHPVVFEDFKRWCGEQGKSPALFFESALLPFIQWEEILDKIIVVTCPEQERIARVMKRDNVSEEQVLARIRAQGDVKAYTSLSRWRIVNDGGRDVQSSIRETIKGILGHGE